MAPYVKFQTAVVLCVLALNNAHCLSFSNYNLTEEGAPRKTVEYFELTLPQNGRVGKKEKEYDRGSVNKYDQAYEIFIKTNNNRQVRKGTHKIKIFFESENYSGEEAAIEHSNVRTPQSESDKIEEVLPLAVKSSGLNIDTFQNIMQANDGSNKAENFTYTSNAYNGKSRSYSIEPPRLTNSSSTHRDSVNVWIDQTANESRKLGMRENRTKAGIYKDNENSERDVSSKYVKLLNNGGNMNLGAIDIGLINHEASFRLENAEHVYQDHVTESFKKQNYSHTESRPSKYGTKSGELRSFDSTYEKAFDIHERMNDRNERQHKTSGSQFDTYNFETHVHSPSLFQESEYPEQSETSAKRPKLVSAHDEIGIPSANPSFFEVRERKTAHSSRSAEELGGRTTYHNPSRINSVVRTRDGGSGHSEYIGPWNDEKIANGQEKSTGKDNYGHMTAREKEGDDYPIINNTEAPYVEVLNRRQSPSSSGNRSVRDNTYSGFPESLDRYTRTSQSPRLYEGISTFPESPCPNVFSYMERIPDRWYGEITIATDEMLVGMRLSLTLNRAAELLAAWSADVKSPDNIHFTVLSLKKRLVPGRPETVRIMVKHHEDGPIPYLEAIALNGRMICPSKTNFPNSNVRITTKRPTYVFPGEIEDQKRTTVPYNIPANVYTTAITTTRRPTSLAIDTTKRPNPHVDSIPLAPGVYENSDPPNYNRPSTKPNRPPFISNKPGNGPKKPKPQHPHAVSAENSDIGHKPITEPTSIGGIANNNGNKKITSGANDQKPLDQHQNNIPCGVPAVHPRPLITNGEMTIRGQWPWHAALYRNMGPNLSYACGASLIDRLHVLTAAHCVTIESSTRPMDAKIFLIYFGKHYLHDWAEAGIVNRGVSRVNVHPNYNATDFRSDIAVLTLSDKVDYTDFVRPVCLWDRRNTRLEDIVGLEGTVVGWGFDEKKVLSRELRQAKMPVVRQNDCLWSYPEFYPKFTSNMTYCAGFKNGTSVCNGDSGGGMVFPIKVNGRDHWFLRGLVSISPSEKEFRVCDTKHYVVFTDVAKYLPWLIDYISEI